MKSFSCVQLFATPWTAAHQQSLHPWDFPGKSTGARCHCFLRQLDLLTSISWCQCPPHSTTLAWKIPGTEEPGGLQFMGSLSRTRLRDFTFTFYFHALEEEMATHSSVLAWRIPGTEGSWWAAVYGVAQGWTRLKQLSSSSSSSRPEQGEFQA